MSWLPLYLADSDRPLLLQILNNSDELAFIVSPKLNHWAATSQISNLQPGRYVLCHLPSGVLPLFRLNNQPELVVEPPSSHWASEQTGDDPHKPVSNHPGLIQLKIKANDIDPSGSTIINMSTFGWIGNRYRAIGQGAAPATERWWKWLRKEVHKQAKLVPRSGPSQNFKPEIYAFPGAMREFENGAAGAFNL